MFRWQNIVDFLILTSLIYLLLRWGRSARALRVLLAIVGLRVGALLAHQLDLPFTTLLLDSITLIAIVLVLIVYQADLRHALGRLDVISWLMPRRAEGTIERRARIIASATFSLARSHAGALIVVTRRDSVSELVTGGIPLGGNVSPEILGAIFNKNSPVHDGAVIIDGDVMATVGAVLPNTDRPRLPKGLGTRHRAAMGLAERCDALVVVASEERGEVSLIHERGIFPIDSAEALERELEVLTLPSPRSGPGLWSLVVGDIGLEAAAVGLAAVVWSLSFVLVGHAIRTVDVPVEFTGVPDDAEIASLSEDTVRVQIRGSEWILDTVSLNTLVARFDLTGTALGPQVFDVDRATLDLPPGLIVEDTSPREISFRLVLPKPPDL